MVETDNSSDIVVQDCLKSLGISLLSDWDVLVFIYRHHSSLMSAEEMGRFLGYPAMLVGDALDRLESQKLVTRSRFSQGVRFYYMVVSAKHLAPASCLRRLMSLAENRTGRLLLLKHLRKSSGLHAAKKGKSK